MRDGVTLATDIYLPPGRGPWPATLWRTPYGRVSDSEAALRMCADGLAIVSQDCRGRFDSDGVFDSGASDGTDGADTVAWVASQPWCDGRVAGRGASYGGLTQWKAAVAGAELVCIAPIMAPGWWRGLSFREGGAVLLAAAAHWLPRQASTDPSCREETREELIERALEYVHVIRNERVSIEAVLAHPAIGRLPLAEPWAFVGSSLFANIWRTLFLQPSGSSSPLRSDRVAAPSLALSGWYDFACQDTIDAYQHLMETSTPSIAGKHRLVLTPHGHGFDPLREVELGAEQWRFGLEEDHRWAREWLLDDGSTLSNLDPVTYFTIGPNEWRGAPHWPPASVSFEDLHLLADRGLSGTRPMDERSVSFLYDPLNPVPSRGGSGMILPPGPCDQEDLTGGARTDVLSFDGPPLTEPLEISGPVTAELFASSSAPDTDFTVKLIDSGPEKDMSVCDGIIRARYRHGTDPHFLVPGKMDRFPVHLGSVSYVVPRGHRLRVDVSSSNFPKFDRNANTGAPEGTDRAEDLRPAEQRVYSSSKITLPVVR